MKFGSFPLQAAEGLILAHTFKADKLILKKGRIITRGDIAALQVLGVKELIGARLEQGDAIEDEAAAGIAQRLAGANVTVSSARTGRCNLVAPEAGVVLVDEVAVTTANLVDESVTVATLPDKQAVKAGQIIATVKIIPFAVDADVMTRLEPALVSQAVALAAYQPKRFALISTVSSSLKQSVIASTEEITRQRITALGGVTQDVVQTGHNANDVARCVKDALTQGAEVVLITGASATVDRGDVVPAGIVAAGGTIDHFGMPVDPGNLLVMAHIGNVPVLVLPGCARSQKLNGVDWVMQRLAANIPVTPRDIMTMGVGGLLVDVPSRPLPRESAVEPATQSIRIAALILAAGQSRRMGHDNKLLMKIEGVPLVRRTVMALSAAKVAQVIVVTGYQDEQVRATLAGLDVTFVHNPDFADGLSTSLRAGIGALGPDISAAVVGLGDMPAVTTAHIDWLIAGFDPSADRAIGVPMHNGKRGNPVLWARRFFAEMQGVSGDVGAKALIGANESLVYEVEFDDTGVLTDLDTPEQWSDYLSRSQT